MTAPFETLGETTENLWIDDEVTTGERYSYRVRSVGELESEPSYQIWALASDATVGVIPPLSGAPPDYSLEIPITTSLSWAAANAVSFVYFVAVGDEVLARAGDLDSKWTPSPPFPLGERVRWKVMAIGETGIAIWSPEFDFLTTPERFLVHADYFAMGGRTVPHPGNPVWVEDFSVDRFETTNDQMARFLTEATASGTAMIENDSVIDSASNPMARFGTGTDILFDVGLNRFLPRRDRGHHPANFVSWSGADRFARSIGRRLPTEAEWEKCSRGTTTQLGDTLIRTRRNGDSLVVEIGFGYPYPWGDEFSSKHSNFKESGDPYDRNVVATTPVGFYDGTEQSGFGTVQNTSPYGAMDMAGNVAEWTADWLGPYRNPHNPGQGPGLLGRIVRGGSWADDATRLANADRRGIERDQMVGWIGFRTVGPP